MWRVVLRAGLQLYPRPWRDRYGQEVLQLMEDADGGIGDAVDLAVRGLAHRVNGVNGGVPMPSLVRWATVIMAATIAAPTAIFIGFQLLNPNVRLVPPGYANWLFPILPALALIIALAPVVRIEMRRDETGATSVTARFLPMRRPLIVVVAFCLALLGVVVAYGVSENLLEAMR